MEIKPVARVGLGVALLGMVGCAPIVWDRPGTTPAQFSIDTARCRLMAEGVNPEPDIGTISTGNFRRDLAANAAAGLAEGLVQGLAVRRDYALCMEANGYVEREPGTNAPAVVASSAVQPGPASPPPTPVAAVPVAPFPSPVANMAPTPAVTTPLQPAPELVRARYYPPPIVVSAY